MALRLRWPVPAGQRNTRVIASALAGICVLLIAACVVRGEPLILLASPPLEHACRIVTFVVMTWLLSVALGLKRSNIAAAFLLAFACLIELFSVTDAHGSTGMLAASNLGIVIAYSALYLYLIRSALPLRSRPG